MIKSGDHKDILSSSREMTSEERSILQSVLDDSFDRFVNIVKEGRDMPESKVRSWLMAVYTVHNKQKVTV